MKWGLIKAGREEKTGTFHQAGRPGVDSEQEKTYSERKEDNDTENDANEKATKPNDNTRLYTLQDTADDIPEEVENDGEIDETKTGESVDKSERRNIENTDTKTN